MAKWLLAFAVVAAVFLLAERRILRGKYSPGWDGDWSVPQYIHLADHARAGKFLACGIRGPARGCPPAAYTEIGSYSPLTFWRPWRPVQRFTVSCSTGMGSGC